MNKVLPFFILSFVFQLAVASVGDDSPYFQHCSYDCISAECTEISKYKKSSLRNYIYSMTYWGCDRECEYECMWKTVDRFQKRNWKVPQFYGKWPFIKFMAMQEPASTVFSLLNLYVHLKMAKKLNQEVRPGSPYLLMWYIQTLVCCHGWVWSAIFHTRDTLLTEFMDYSCAYSMVLYSFYLMIMRYLSKAPQFILVIVTVLCLSFYGSHITYLYTGRFDYRYNMQVNVITGVAVIIGWITFAILYRRQAYTRKIALFSIVVAITTLLELIDIPPLLWIFDSHALWHLSTVPAPYLLYSFAIDDCKYLRKQLELRRKDSF